MYINYKVVLNIYYIFISLLLLESMKVYLFWEIPHIIPIVVFFISIITLLRFRGFFFFSKQNILLTFFFLIALLYTLRNSNFNGYIAGLFPFVSVGIVFNLTKYNKALLLNFLTKVIALIMFISLPIWILVQFGINFPYTKISYTGGSDTYFLNCYYVFIEYTHNITFQRYMSIFIEPGYLGSLISILLFVNNFNFRKKRVLILFLSLILTFSIAGYIMFIVAYILHIFYYKKQLIQKIIFTILFLTIAYFTFSSFNNGDNIINQLVIERFSYDDDKIISGNNRTNKEFNEYFLSFIKSKDSIFGDYTNSVVKGNVGIKPFIIQHGFIGLALVLIAYYYAYNINKNKFSFTLLLLFLMIFIKGHSELFWAGFLIIYGISTSQNYKWQEKIK